MDPLQFFPANQPFLTGQEWGHDSVCGLLWRAPFGQPHKANEHVRTSSRKHRRTRPIDCGGVPESAARRRLMDRLDEEKLEMLRIWGEGLLNDGRDELRAAGRAIMILVEEIELLHVELWHAHQNTPKKGESQGAESEGSRTQLSLALQRRISALRSRGLSGSADE